MRQSGEHVVVIVGGAVAGSEAAFQLAERGVLCLVLEQNPRPYGKIEDGLPRWHVELRIQEEKRIDEKLSHARVRFIPLTRIGRDITFGEILGWGCSAVILANGAWRDRPLPLDGVDRFVGKGFYYQNPFVYWFNHYPEPGYQGLQVEPLDGALVVGGGLASLDVVKILMLETVSRSLAARGHQVSLLELERQGCRKVLMERGLNLSDLGLRGCTLFYRRRLEDMPVVEPPEHASLEQLEKARATRRKLLANFVEKYLFRFVDMRVPVGYVANGDCLTGLRFAAAEVRDGHVEALPGNAYEEPSPLVISSIGSIPEPIFNLAMNGDSYRLRNPSTGEVDGLEGVFAVGNAVTGRGNILVSRKHGRVVSQHMLESYLMGTAAGYEEVLAGAAAAARQRVAAVAEHLAGHEPLSAERVKELIEKAAVLQRRVGYKGDYREWIERVRLPQV